MAYDKKAAVSYAVKFWNVVTHDGCAAIGHDPWYKTLPAGTKYVPSKDSTSEDGIDPDGNVVVTWADLDDCTHFISCCLGTPGGGLNIPTSFPGGPYGILSAHKLGTMVIEKKWGTVLADKIKDETKALDVMKNSMEAGDLTAYWDPIKSRHRHLALHLGDGKISCHTFCRYGTDWREVGWPKWTLISLG